ncbi:MAG: hypothetical protein ACOYWZ_02680 [Bacillota bacterium]
MVKIKRRRTVAVIIVMSLILTSLAVSTGIVSLNKVNTANAQNNNDQKIAEDISNMTGEKTKDILKLKNEGKSWNEILEILKNNSGQNQVDRENRSDFLTESDLGDEYVEKLKKEGFTQEEIMEAKSLVERVMFNLREITEKSLNKPDIPKVEVGETLDTEEDTPAYEELAGKIDLKIAVYLILKLESEFGSMEGVLDEYLYSIQIGADLEKMIIDKEAYEEEKREKGAGLDIKKIITLAKIEEKLLQKIQSQNNNKVEFDIDPKSGEAKPGLEPEAIKPPLPDIGPKDVKPKDPLEDVMKEINDIRNRSLNIESNIEGR